MVLLVIQVLLLFRHLLSHRWYVLSELEQLFFPQWPHFWQLLRLRKILKCRSLLGLFWWYSSIQHIIAVHTNHSLDLIVCVVSPLILISNYAILNQPSVFIQAGVVA